MHRLLLFTLLLPAAAPAADILKANNGDPYGLGTSWEGGVVPGPDDIAVWDGNFTQTAPPRPYLNGDLSVRGVRVTINAAQKAQFDKSSASAPEVLTTIGAGGLVIENFGLGVNLGSNVLLSADQPWITTGTVGASGITYLSPLKLDNEATIDFGGHTVTKTGPAPVSFLTNTLGNCTLRNGTLIMNAGELQINSSVQMTSVSPVPRMRVPSSFTVRLNPGSSLRPFNQHATVENLEWNARVELSGGTLFGCGQQVLFGDGRSWPSTLGGVIDVQASSFLMLPGEINNLIAEHKITARITGSASLSLRNQTASSAQSNHSLVLAGDNAGFSGTFVLDGSAGRRSVRLRGAQAGSAAAAWTLTNLNTLEIESCDVSLGSLAGTGITGSVTAVGGGTSLVTIGARNTTTTYNGLLANAAGSLLAVRKTGTGSLTLNNAGSEWTGDTIVDSGTLNLNSLLHDASTVRLAAGAVLRVKPGVTDTVARLIIDGVMQPAGTYGAVGSTAANQSAAFTGTGILDVQSGISLNPYITWIHSFAGFDSTEERAEAFDYDGDGMTNFAEFVTHGNPEDKADNALIRTITEPGGAVTFIVPVTNASFPGLSVEVRTSTDLLDFSTPATFLPAWTPPAGTPALPSGWDYRAYRGPSGASRLFFRAVVTP